MEAEAESEKVQLEKGVEGVVVSLELDEVVQAVEEGQAPAMVMESHSQFPQKKEVEEGVEGAGVAVRMSPGPGPSHHLDQQYLTREFEALKKEITNLLE